MPRALVAALAFALLLGGGLRLYGLDDKVFWHDEVYSTLFAAGYQSHDWQEVLWTGDVVPIADVQRFLRPAPDRGVFDTVAGLARDEPQHPPLYYVLARTWVGLIGDGVARLRLLSALLGLLAIPAMFWLADELYCDRRRAWAAAALMALSPFFVLYAQESREYVLWGILTVCSTAQLLRAIRHSDARSGEVREWTAFALITALSLYTAFSAAAVILGQVVFICLRERLRFTRLSLSAAAAMAGAALLFLPWAVVLHARLEAFSASMAWSRTIVIPRTELLALFGSNLSRSIVDFWADATGLAWGLVVAAVAVLATGAVSMVRSVPWRKAALPVLVGLAPVVILLVPDLLFGGIRSISARYLTPTLAMGLLAVAGLVGSRRGDILVGIVAVVAGASCLHNAGTDSPWTKGISRNLPVVAEAINASTSPLIVANRERHHPGNLLALSAILNPDAAVQVLAMQDAIEPLPAGFTNVYLFSPTPQYRDELTALEGVTLTPLHQDLHMELWRVDR
jgi:uncharacterized membrane protein